MLTFSLVTVTIAALSCQVSSYSTGAPPAACQTLTPSHNNMDGRITGCPVQIIAPDYYSERRDLTITLRRIGARNFKGYILAVLESNSTTNTVTRAFGVFNPEEGQQVICNGMAVTHTESDLKTEVNVTWKAPPNREGDPPKRYFVWLTVVESFRWFWLNQCGRFYIISDTFRPNTTVAPETTTTTTTAVTTTYMETEASTTQEPPNNLELSAQPASNEPETSIETLSSQVALTEMLISQPSTPQMTNPSRFGEMSIDDIIQNATTPHSSSENSQTVGDVKTTPEPENTGSEIKITPPPSASDHVNLPDDEPQIVQTKNAASKWTISPSTFTLTLLGFLVFHLDFLFQCL